MDDLYVPIFSLLKRATSAVAQTFSTYKMYKVWLQISKQSVKDNVAVFRRLISPKTEIWAVVKSNAYGHGLVLFSKLVQADVDGFCVDSVVEGEKLRNNGITRPILVLGPTLAELYSAAVKSDLIVTISNVEALRAWQGSKIKPNFHLKIDTGMHRQGFYPEDLSKILNLKFKISNFLKGVYTHFASAKDINYPSFTEYQFSNFKKAVAILESAGFKKLKKHVSATGGALVNKNYHLDIVRVGIGLYGLWPSRELEMQLSDKIELAPVLSWHVLVSEIKKVRRGDYVGYDLTEKINSDGRLAIVPIGYWHGLPRALSSVGEVWVGRNKCRILGRVSMDLIAIDVTGVNCRVGDEVRLVPMEIAQKLGASHYEIITRINPLIKKIIK